MAPPIDAKLRLLTGHRVQHQANRASQALLFPGASNQTWLAGKSLRKMKVWIGKYRKILYKWWIVGCHVWLAEGMFNGEGGIFIFNMSDLSFFGPA